MSEARRGAERREIVENILFGARFFGAHVFLPSLIDDDSHTAIRCVSRRQLLGYPDFLGFCDEHMADRRSTRSINGLCYDQGFIEADKIDGPEGKSCHAALLPSLGGKGIEISQSLQCLALELSGHHFLCRPTGAYTRKRWSCCAWILPMFRSLAVCEQ